MADTTTDPKDTKAVKAAALKAWHDADTDAKKRAAVKEFPILTEMYALALTFVVTE